MVAATPPPVDPWALFLRARSAVTSAAYPWRLDYTIAITGLDGAKRVSDHYRASCDPTDGSIKLFPISDEQLAAPPPVPHGVNVKFNIGICFFLCTGVSLPMGHPAPYQDLLGEPHIAPIYMFGLRYGRVPYNVKPVGVETALPVIATVSTRERNYDVSFLGMETVDGVDTYHLGLKPLRKPKDNRLRELWIGTTDYLPRKAVVSGNFTEAPLVDVPWAINFSVVDGMPFVTQESTEATLYLPHRRVVRDATISFENISEPDGSIFGRPLVVPDGADDELEEPASD